MFLLHFLSSLFPVTFFSSPSSTHAFSSSFFNSFLAPPLIIISLLLLLLLLRVTKLRLCPQEQYVYGLSSIGPKMQGEVQSSMLWEIHYYVGNPQGPSLFLLRSPLRGKNEKVEVFHAGSLYSRVLGRQEEGFSIKTYILQKFAKGCRL